MKTSQTFQAPLTPLDSVTAHTRFLLSLFILILTFQSMFARAQEKPNFPPSKPTSDAEASIKITRDARGRKVQTIDFSDALIEGKARTPDGIVIQSRKAGRFRSLIELRSHFRDNIKTDTQQGILDHSSLNAR